MFIVSTHIHWFTRLNTFAGIHMCKINETVLTVLAILRCIRFLYIVAYLWALARTHTLTSIRYIDICIDMKPYSYIYIVHVQQLS